jgi:dCTP deaminase
MILVDYQIRELCEKGLVTPYDPSLVSPETLVNPASLDIRIGGDAVLEDPAGGFYDIDISSFSKDQPFILEPGEWILVSSIEVFDFPATVAGLFKLKSSRAREGWDCANAGWAEPRFNGSRFTAAIKNILRFNKISLYPGMRFGQILLLETTSAAKDPYDKVGRYNGDLSAQRSKG